MPYNNSLLKVETVHMILNKGLNWGRIDLLFSIVMNSSNIAVKIINELTDDFVNHAYDLLVSILTKTKTAAIGEITLRSNLH
ncbi:malate synthase [Paenibacillus sp. NAIST15-1]|nr:malate synthase [Paenibacillus sp. NAIST15-1]